jgi:cytochrome c oxidase cbb3-type subunit II
MRFGPLVFLAAFLGLSASWCGMVLTPQVQLGRAVQETNSVVKTDLYPAGRAGLAREGLEIYRANGCVYCHSQQVEQKSTLVDVVLKDAGKTPMAVATTLNEAHLGNFSGPTAGAVTELRLVAVGADIERGWGMRRTVAQDFISDATVMPGSLRVGPDLANVGARRPDLNWQLMHLYNPAAVTQNSPMPSYPFLFERKKIGKQPSSDALQLKGKFAPPPGYEIVPKPEGRALAAYLVSLRSDTPLYEAPLTPPPVAATNAPAK